jgi:hypothetical protein
MNIYWEYRYFSNVDTQLGLPDSNMDPEVQTIYLEIKEAFKIKELYLVISLGC